MPLRIGDVAIDFPVGLGALAGYSDLPYRLICRSLGAPYCITEAMHKKGFSFIEVLAPCPTSFGRRNKIRKSLDLVRFLHERSVIKNDLDPREAALDFHRCPSPFFANTSGGTWAASSSRNSCWPANSSGPSMRRMPLK